MNSAKFVWMRLFAVMIFFALSIPPVTAQYLKPKPVKVRSKTTNLSFGTGLSSSVLLLERNIKEDNNANGYVFSLSYGGAKFIRVCNEFSWFRSINIEPTWYNIKAWTAESNVHFIFRFENANSYFYPIAGLSFNRFSGTFTGKNDFMGFLGVYKVNSRVTTDWIGANMGTGAEFRIKRFSFYGEYKMRIGIQDGRRYSLNIMDVCLSAGVKYNIRVRNIYAKQKGVRSRYLLKTEDNEE